MTWDAIAWNIGLGIAASALWEALKAGFARLRPSADKGPPRPADEGGRSMNSAWKFGLPRFVQNALIFAVAFAAITYGMTRSAFW